MEDYFDSRDEDDFDNDGSCEPSEPSSPDDSARDRWIDSIRFGVMAASTHFNVLSNTEYKDENFELLSLKRKGKFVACIASGLRGHTVQRLKPGMNIKLITVAYDDKEPLVEEDKFSNRKRKTKSSVLDAEIKSVSPDKDSGYFDVKVELELTSKGLVFEDRLAEARLMVPCRTRTKEFKEHMGLLRRFGGLWPEKLMHHYIEHTRPESGVSYGDFSRRDEHVLESSPDLDEAQNLAYGMAMDTQNYPVLFVHGGPGTGKTRTICRIVEEHVRRGKKVLVLSHSNKGAQVPALMLKKNTDIKVYIAGNNASVVDPKLHKDRIKRGVNFPVAALREIDTNCEGITGSVDGTNHHNNTKDYKEAKKKQVLEKYKAKLAKAKKKFQDSIKHGGAAFSTLGTLIGDDVLSDTEFNVVIVDEATRLRMPDMLLALKKANAQVIFVGDPLQLGNIPLDPELRGNLQRWIASSVGGKLSSDQREKYGEDNIVVRMERLLGRRLRPGRNVEDVSQEIAGRIADLYEEGPFSRGILQCDEPEKELPYVFLNKNRRSRPNIVKVLSELMYGGKLLPGRESKEGEHDGIVQWVDTGSIGAKERTSGTSRRNSKEADVVVRMVLDTVIGKKVPPEDVAVIATYAEQAELIKTKLSRFLHNSPEFLKKLLHNVASVDAFQGDERKIVFVSLTRSNKEGAIGFLEEERRLGVAVGRAQDELYVVGDTKTLVETNNNPQSKEFFGKMHGLIGQYGEVKKEQYRSPKKRHKKRHHKEPAKIAAVA